MSDNIEYAPKSISLEDAVYVVRDGVILLECVESTDDAQAAQGILVVHAEEGSFNVRVNIDDALHPRLSDQYGGIWGEHPQFPAEDWRLEVENHDTRIGYWDWVASKIEDAEANDDDDPPAGQSDESVNYSRD